MSRSRLALLLVTCVAVLAALAAVAIGQGDPNPGNTWYVTDSGNDANSCATPDQACRTIEAVQARAESSATIRACGTFQAPAGGYNFSVRGQRWVGCGDGGAVSHGGWMIRATNRDGTAVRVTGDRITLDYLNIRSTQVRTATLAQAITASSPANGENLQLKNGAQLDPDKGYVTLTDKRDEVVRYESRDGDTLVNITRGVGATKIQDWPANRPAYQGTFRGILLRVEGGWNSFPNLSLNGDAGSAAGGVYGGTGMFVTSGESNRFGRVFSSGLGLDIHMGWEGSVGEIDHWQSAGGYRGLLNDNATMESVSYLADDLAPTASSVPLETPTAIPSPYDVRIGNEAIDCTGIDGLGLTGCTRGAVRLGVDTEPSFQPKRREVVAIGNGVASGGWTFGKVKFTSNQEMIHDEQRGDGSHEYGVDFAADGGFGGGGHVFSLFDSTEGPDSDTRIGSSHNVFNHSQGSGGSEYTVQGDYNQFLQHVSDNGSPDAFVLATGTQGNVLHSALTSGIRDDGANVVIGESRGTKNQYRPPNLTWGPHSRGWPTTSAVLPTRPRTTGRWYGGTLGGEPADVTLARGEGCITPFHVSGQAHWNSLAVRVSSTGAHGTLAFGVYVLDPTTLLPADHDTDPVLGGGFPLVVAPTAPAGAPGVVEVPVDVNVQSDWMGVLIFKSGVDPVTLDGVRSDGRTETPYGRAGFGDRPALAPLVRLPDGGAPKQPPISGYGESCPRVLARMG